MTEIIKLKDTSYSRYEQLLLRRDQLKKEAYIYSRDYVAEFGDLILAVFEKKISCIRKKKTIEFCQSAANYGNAVDQLELQAFLEEQMAEFEAQLASMVEDTESAKERSEITELDALKIKKIYHRLVKLIHPDINPFVAESEELLDLWNRVTIAYDCNQLQELEELEVLVTVALEKAGADHFDLDIKNLDEKIEELEAEIKHIRETDPYQYKYLLEDPDAVEAKKNALREELKSYEDYEKQLEEILEDLLSQGVTMTWRMN